MPTELPTLEEVRVLWQLIVIVVAAMVVLITDLFLPDQENDPALATNTLDRIGARLVPNEKDWLAYISLAGIIGATIVGVRQWPLVSSAGGQVFFGFGDTVVVDQFTLLMNFIFLAVAALVILMAPRYLSNRAIARGEFYALLLFSTSGLMLMAAAANLITLFLGLEVLSIPLYILASFMRPRLDSEESGIKYFLLGAFSSAFLLYGIALTYGATGTTSLNGIRQVLFGQLQSAQLASNPMLIGGLALLMVGLGFKVAVAPFHQWTPDVYQGAPTPVTAFMVAGTKAGGFAALIRVLLLGFLPVSPLWQPLVAGLAVITMTVGNVGALLQQNVKRMMAYSSIAHAGYILIAVAAAQRGVGAAVVYLAVYALMNLGAFACIIAISEGTRERINVDDYAGLAGRRPFLAAALSAFLLSLAGFPPLAGFFAKFYVFLAGVDAGLTWLVVVGVLNSVVSVFYYARIIVAMYMRAPDEEPLGRPGWLTTAGLILALLGVIILGLFPSAVLNLITG